MKWNQVKKILNSMGLEFSSNTSSGWFLTSDIFSMNGETGPTIINTDDIAYCFDRVSSSSENFIIKYRLIEERELASTRFNMKICSYRSGSESENTSPRIVYKTKNIYGFDTYPGLRIKNMDARNPSVGDTVFVINKDNLTEITSKTSISEISFKDEYTILTLAENLDLSNGILCYAVKALIDGEEENSYCFADYKDYSQNYKVYYLEPHKTIDDADGYIAGSYISEIAFNRIQILRRPLVV